MGPSIPEASLCFVWGESQAQAVVLRPFQTITRGHGTAHKATGRSEMFNVRGGEISVPAPARLDWSPGRVRGLASSTTCLSQYPKSLVCAVSTF